MDIATFFRSAVRLGPNKPALIYGNKEWSYAELDHYSDQIAAGIIQKGMNGRKIGVCMERTPEWIATIIGIWKAGSVYIPLDPNNPPGRLYDMITDCEPDMIIGIQLWPPTPKRIQVFSVEKIRYNKKMTVSATAEQGAYIIYSSGTSGKPKGVLVRNGQAVDLGKESKARVFYTSRENRQLQMAAPGFNASIVEILAALLHGVCLVIATEEEKKNPQLLYNLLLEKHVESALIPPALLAVMPQKELPDLHTLAVAGEETSEKIRNFWMKGRRMVNAYGFTENTVLVSSVVYDQNTPVNDIGTPVKDTRIYILDESLKPVPEGHEGELCVSGYRVVEGYLKCPELTANKFIANPFANESDKQKGIHQTIYRSGDRVKQLPNGHYLYLGRLDRQINLKGIRIEPAEIEACLISYPGVNDCVVMEREVKGRMLLVAYLLTDQDISSSEINIHVRNKLPFSMCPQAFVMMSHFPMTNNGKTDRNKLPLPSHTEFQGKNPSTETEKKIARIWCKILGLPSVGGDDNFIGLGGDSISVMILAQELEEAFKIPVRNNDIFAHATLLELSAFIDKQKVRHSIQKIQLPPTFRNLLVSCLTSSESNESYKLGVVFSWNKELDTEALNNVWNRILCSQESLRSSFKIEDNKNATLCVHTHQEADLPYKEIKTDDFIQEIQTLYQQNLHPLSYPLHHECLFRLSDGSYKLVLVFHHLIADGWSVNLLYRFLQEGIDKKSHIIPEGNFMTYIKRQNLEKQADISFKKMFWKNYLYGCENSSLNINKDAENEKGRQGAALTVAMTQDAEISLFTLARKLKATPISIALTIFILLLEKYSDLSDFIVGIAATNRKEKELWNTIGYLVTLLPVRAPSFHDGFPSAVRCLSEHTRLITEHQLPLNQILEVWETENRIEKNRIRFSFGLEESPSDPSLLDECIQTSEFDLSLIIYRYKNKCVYHFQYKNDSFNETFMRIFAESFNTALIYFSTDPMSDIRKCPLMPKKGIERIIRSNQLTESIHTPWNIIKEFERMAFESPDRTVCIWKGKQMNYKTIIEQTIRMATAINKKLTDSCKTKEKATIGLYLKEKEFLIPGILGILKSGNTYVPLDCYLPIERLKYIITNADIQLVVTDNQFHITDCPTLTVDQALKENDLQNKETPKHCPTDIAYIIYTSGTSGSPKGVPIRHKELSLLTDNLIQAFDLQPDMSVLQYANIGFDASILEIFPALFSRSVLVIPSEEERRDGNLLLNLMEKEKVSCALIPPALLAQLPYRELKDLQTLIVGGESTPYHVMKLWGANRKLINAYGPTENTVVTTYSMFHSNMNPNNIGTPLPGVSCYVIGKDMTLMPDGIPGELYIGGLQLTQGYIRQNDLNQERFVNNPYVSEEEAAQGINTRLYKSGDRVIRTSEGNFIFLGRTDSQIKLRGFRIELKEIERNLEECPSVKQAKIILKKTNKGQPYLAAYYTSDKGKNNNPQQLRDYLSRYLPYYMIPSTWCKMNEFPRTSNGKIATSLLPEAHPLPSAVNEKPQNTQEEELAKIVEKLLDTEDVGVNINLLEAGISSLQILEFIHEAEKKGISLSVADIYHGGCIRNILKLQTGNTFFWRQNKGRPVVIFVCGYSSFHSFYTAFSEFFENEYDVFVFDTFLNNYPETDAIRLVEQYYHIIHKKLTHRQISLITGHCLGGELALLLGEMLRQKDYPQIKVLAIDSLITRNKALILPERVKDSTKAVHIQMTNNIIQTMPRILFKGKTMACLAKYPANKLSPDQTNIDENVLKKIQEVFRNNHKEWKKISPKAFIREFDTDHWNFFQPEILKQMCPSIKNWINENKSK